MIRQRLEPINEGIELCPAAVLHHRRIRAGMASTAGAAKDERAS
jgi:hypothetical protein